MIDQENVKLLSPSNVGNSWTQPVWKARSSAQAAKEYFSATWLRTAAGVCALSRVLPRQWEDAKANPKIVFLAAKAGLASSITALLCIIDVPYDWVASLGIWAVITVDLVFESDVGTSLSKGVNRVLGTLGAGLAALLLSHLTDLLPTILAPVATLAFVFFGAAIPLFYRFRPPFKDRWNYAMTMMMITFHMLLLSNLHLRFNNLWLPLARFTMIVFGFGMAAAVNLAFAPNYAGSLLHSLLSKNLESSADVLNWCIEEYTQGTILDHFPNMSQAKGTRDDRIYALYHQVVMSDADVDRLLGAVVWEPPHGPFFRGYPWKMYEEMLDALRYTVFDIIALDSCLRAEIQAPTKLRMLVADEMKAISESATKAMRHCAANIKAFQWDHPQQELQVAKLAALQLQHKISRHLGAFVEVSGSSRSQLHKKSELARRPDELVEQQETSGRHTVTRATHQQGETTTSVHAVLQELAVNNADSTQSSDGRSNDLQDPSLSSSKKNLPEVAQGSVAPARADSDVATHTSDLCTCPPLLQSAGCSVHGPSRLSWPLGLDNHSGKAPAEEIQKKSQIPTKCFSHSSQSDPAANEAAHQEWLAHWLESRPSMAKNWDETLEHITALSLVKFASLLLEIVAKMTHITNGCEALATAGKFRLASDSAGVSFEPA